MIYRSNKPTPSKDTKKPMRLLLLLGVIVLTLLVISCIVIFIRNSINRSDEIKRFQTIDISLTELADAIEASPELDTTVKKENRCAKQYSGINSSIECGIQIGFETSTVSGQTLNDSIKDVLVSHSSVAGVTFLDELPDQNDSVSGWMSFILDGNLCSGMYTRFAGGMTNYRIGCSAQVSDFIDGYTII